MKLLKIGQNPKVMLVIGVFVLSMITIGVSYSAFFSIKSNTSNQTYTTGNLEVTYTSITQDSKDYITSNNMHIMNDKEGLEQNDSNYIYVRNTGSLSTTYSLNVGYDIENYNKRTLKDPQDILTPLEYIKIAVFRYDGPEKNTLILGPVTLADLPVYSIDKDDYNKNRYLLLFSDLPAGENATKTYVVKTWLSNDASIFAANSYFYVNSRIVAEVSETKVAYTFKGILKNGAGPLNGATISVQNSITATTDANGNFTLANLLPGSYELDIKYNDKVYNTSIKIRKGDTYKVIKDANSSFEGTGERLQNKAYTLGTTINKLKQINNIKETSITFTFGKSTYQAPVVYIIDGTLENQGNLVISVDDTNITNMVIE